MRWMWILLWSYNAVAFSGYDHLALKYAPVIVHHSSHPASYPFSLFADGDEDFSNNPVHFMEDLHEFGLEYFEVPDQEKRFPMGTPTVYYDVFESEDLWVFIYSIYNPKDLKSGLGKVGHDHDFEGVMIFIGKDGSQDGRFLFALTKAHEWMIPYTNEPGLKRFLKADSKLSWFLKIMDRTSKRHHNPKVPLYFAIDENDESRGPILFVGPRSAGHGFYKFNPCLSAHHQILQVSLSEESCHEKNGYIDLNQAQPKGGRVYAPAGVGKKNLHIASYQLERSTDRIFSPSVRFDLLHSNVDSVKNRFYFPPKQTKISEPSMHSMHLEPLPNLPYYFLNSKMERDQDVLPKANTIFGWEAGAGHAMGIDPVGLVYRKFPTLAKALRLSKKYLFNIYAKQECFHVRDQECSLL